MHTKEIANWKKKEQPTSPLSLLFQSITSFPMRSLRVTLVVDPKLES